MGLYETRVLHIPSPRLGDIKNTTRFVKHRMKRKFISDPTSICKKFRHQNIPGRSYIRAALAFESSSPPSPL